MPQRQAVAALQTDAMVIVLDLVLAVVHKVALEDVDLELVPLNYKKKDPLFREGHYFFILLHQNQ